MKNSKTFLYCIAIILVWLFVVKGFDFSSEESTITNSESSTAETDNKSVSNYLTGDSGTSTTHSTESGTTSGGGGKKLPDYLTGNGGQISNSGTSKAYTS